MKLVDYFYRMEIIKMIRFVLIAGILYTSVIISSCRKEVATSSTRTIIDSIQHAWYQEPEFNNGDMDITNAIVSKGSATFSRNKAYFWGAQNDDYYIIDSTTPGYWASSQGITIDDVSTNRRPAVCKDYFAFADVSGGGYVGFISQQIEQFGPASFNKMKVYDPNFVSYPNFSYNFQPINSIDISDSERVIIPVITKDSTKGYFYLFDAKPDVNGVIQVSNFHKVAFGHAYLQSAPYITHIGNRFLVPYDSIHLIREDFSTKAIGGLEDFTSVFKTNGNYYAVGFSGKIYETTDMGETWTLQFSLNQWVIVVNFDNNLIAYHQDQLWLVTISSTNLTLKEIVNDGLTGKTISNIVKYNNKIWISTNAGVFSRPYSSFYQYK